MIALPLGCGVRRGRTPNVVLTIRVTPIAPAAPTPLPPKARLPRHRRRGVHGLRRTDQHVLFLTDGQPTAGDRSVAREMQLAEELGVAVHTIFIGNSHCPAVLDKLSERTGGSRLAAYFDVEAGAIQAMRRHVL